MLQIYRDNHLKNHTIYNNLGTRVKFKLTTITQATQYNNIGKRHIQCDRRTIKRHEFLANETELEEEKEEEEEEEARYLPT